MTMTASPASATHSWTTPCAASIQDGGTALSTALLFDPGCVLTSVSSITGLSWHASSSQRASNKPPGTGHGEKAAGRLVFAISSSEETVDAGFVDRVIRWEAMFGSSVMMTQTR